MLYFNSTNGLHIYIRRRQSIFLRIDTFRPVHRRPAHLPLAAVHLPRIPSGTKNVRIWKRRQIAEHRPLSPQRRSGGSRIPEKLTLGISRENFRRKRPNSAHKRHTIKQETAAWNHAAVSCLVENTRLELVTSCMPCKPIPIRYNILTSSIITAYKHTSPQ